MTYLRRVRARDYYKTLNVPKGASDAEIKRAYRRLARQYHPDVTGDDDRSTERFKEITEAYEVLSDPKRRRSYDLFGAPGPVGVQPEASPFSGVADIFADVMRRASRRTGPEPGVDVEHGLGVSLAEAATGCERSVDIDLTRACDQCAGKGYPADKPPETCPECGGSGTKGGAFPLKRSCSRCDGLGTIRRYTCRACAGEGQRKVPERLKVTVPAGVDTGTRLRLKGKGEAGREGGPPGDLYVVIQVRNDERFEREGADLRTTLKVGLRQALLGGKLDVPLPDGVAVMSLPAGTQGGQVFRIKGKGMPRLQGDKPGDVLVTVQLRVPKQLSDDARRLIERLAESVPDL